MADKVELQLLKLDELKCSKIKLLSTGIAFKTNVERMASLGFHSRALCTYREVAFSTHDQSFIKAIQESNLFSCELQETLDETTKKKSYSVLDYTTYTQQLKFENRQRERALEQEAREDRQIMRDFKKSFFTAENFSANPSLLEKIGIIDKVLDEA